MEGTTRLIKTVDGDAHTFTVFRGREYHDDDCCDWSRCTCTHAFWSHKEALYGQHEGCRYCDCNRWDAQGPVL